MILSRKIELDIKPEQAAVINSQSKICNWLYNKLYELAEEDYKNGGEKNLLYGRNLRNQVPILKETNPFLKTVHSSPLKNAAIRLKESYDKFFRGECAHPHFRSWKKKWFSLLYDEPNKGFKLCEGKLRLSLGVNDKNKRLSVTASLKEDFKLTHGSRIKTLEIIKDMGRYYAVFCIERPQHDTHNKTNKWIALDMNHKNLMVGVDQDGNTYEFKNLSQVKYWDRKIDELKSKRDRYIRKSQFVNAGEGRGYYKPSKRWERLNKALDCAYNSRREQIKQGLYAIGNFIARNYDLAVIGDYTPTLQTAVYNNMHRSMLNQTVVSKARDIIFWVMERSDKQYRMVDETNTTKECCICGSQEKKSPEIRIFTCSNCENTMIRDVNSAVNIAKKEKLLPGLGYIGREKPMYTVAWDYKHCSLQVQMN